MDDIVSIRLSGAHSAAGALVERRHCQNRVHVIETDTEHRRIPTSSESQPFRAGARRIPGCILAATGLEPAEATRLMREVVRLREALESRTGAADY